MKTKLAAAFVAIGMCAYFIVDFIKTKYDRPYRIAAGESVYEKAHAKKEAPITSMKLNLFNFFSRADANKILTELQKLNEERAGRLLLHMTEYIRANVQCGTTTFIGNRTHPNEVKFEIEPVSMREMRKAYWKQNGTLSVYVNNADLDFVTSSLEDLGYSVYDVKDRHTTLRSFTVSWT